jgi:hypothetical protein
MRIYWVVESRKIDAGLFQESFPTSENLNELGLHH